MDRHRFDADPDPDPNVHVDADPDTDPDWHQDDAHCRPSCADPATSFIHVGKSEFILL